MLKVGITGSSSSGLAKSIIEKVEGDIKSNTCNCYSKTTGYNLDFIDLDKFVEEIKYLDVFINFYKGKNFFQSKLLYKLWRKWTIMKKNNNLIIVFGPSEVENMIQESSTDITNLNESRLTYYLDKVALKKLTVELQKRKGNHPKILYLQLGAINGVYTKDKIPEAHVADIVKVLFDQYYASESIINSITLNPCI